jgi:hypothetical protein
MEDRFATGCPNSFANRSTPNVVHIVDHDPSAVRREPNRDRFADAARSPCYDRDSPLEFHRR